MVIPRLRGPIVLVHGLFGFDHLRLGPWLTIDYFRGIPEALRAAGNRVRVARLSPTAGIADRAGQLKALLDREFPAEPVHLIAHSLGGLDARYLISRLHVAPRVLSLTTLGTPHRGSSVAEWGVHHFAPVVRPLLAFVGLPYQAFLDLTVTRCREFNRTVPDVPGVRYFSVAGRFQGGWHSPHWQLLSRKIEQVEGPNDGVVSVASATYGESCAVWEADHVDLVNWRTGRDRIPDYAALVGRLADQGF
jgi:triacylglycerol lipase